MELKVGALISVGNKDLYTFYEQMTVTLSSFDGIIAVIE